MSKLERKLAKYPRLGTTRKATLPEHARPVTCAQCNRAIVGGEPYVQADFQWTFFRGDDDVIELCADCLRNGRPDIPRIARRLSGER